MWKSSSKYACKCHGLPRAHMPFLTHNMARPPKDFFATDFRVSPRKICGKICSATLSGRTIFLSIEARFKVRGLFLPHIMAADTWRPHQGKKGKKGHATLCGRTVGALVLCLQRLRRDSRHIIWRESAMIWFMSAFGDS